MSNYTTTTTGTLSVSVPIPTVTSNSSCITVNTGVGWDMMGNSYITSYDVGLSSFMVEMHANNIIQKEMAIARKNNPGVDWKRINNMLNSDDNEMKQLGLTSIGEYTIYVARILASMIYQNSSELSSIVNEYITMNRINITEEVL